MIMDLTKDNYIYAPAELNVLCLTVYANAFVHGRELRACSVHLSEAANVLIEILVVYKS